MRIGIMLRHFNQHGGGVLVYTRHLLQELLSMNTPHEVVLFYADPKLIGTFSNFDRVTEVAFTSPHILLWDQIGMRKAEKKYGLDLIFNPKYSLPLRSKCKTVFVSHGLYWYLMPWGEKYMDRMNHKHLYPRFVRKADRIIAVSETTRKHLIDFLGADPGKVDTIHLGVNPVFGIPAPESRTAEVRAKYNLPDRFFLYVGQIYPPKNFGRLLQAYAKVGPQAGVHLVAAGEHRMLCEDDLALIDKLNLKDWVHQPGWINHDTLGALYAMAESLVMPSLYEACPSPPMEAMLSGCAVVTSNRYGTAEIAGDAGILVDPDEVESIAEGMRQVLENPALKQEKIAIGRERVKRFSWFECARSTLATLEAA